jgi:hypothetical protein
MTPTLTRILAGGALAAATLALSTDAALARNGAGGGGGGAPAAARCATLVVANNGQTVRNRAMPDVKYSLQSCGTDALSVTVTVRETAGFLSVLCPSPVAPPRTVALGSAQKLSLTASVLRGPCGYAGSQSSVLVNSSQAWQGHNLQLTATDDATGAVLSSAPFSWQDARSGV